MATSVPHPRALVALVLVALVGLTTLNLAPVGAASNWVTSLATGSKGEGQSRPAITTLTTYPVTFSAACTSSSSESATLTWTTTGSATTGYEVLVSSTLNGTYALDATQPSGTALTVTETYTTAGNKYYRLEAKSANWAFPGTTAAAVANAREAKVASTVGGYLAMATTPSCTAN